MKHPARWIIGFAAATIAAPPPVVAQAPPVRVVLDDAFDPGQRAKVLVRLATDGYLVVLRADAQGRIRVLFPVDPADSAVVAAGKDFLVLDRGGREGFVVDDRDGGGLVVAARANTPFDFQAFTRGVHWDWRALRSADSSATGETALVDVLDRMATSDYDYDVLPYSVRNRSSSGRYVGRP